MREEAKRRLWSKPDPTWGCGLSQLEEFSGIDAATNSIESKDGNNGLVATREHELEVQDRGIRCLYG